MENESTVQQESKAAKEEMDRYIEYMLEKFEAAETRGDKNYIERWFERSG